MYTSGGYQRHEQGVNHCAHTVQRLWQTVARGRMVLQEMLTRNQWVLGGCRNRGLLHPGFSCLVSKWFYRPTPHRCNPCSALLRCSLHICCDLPPPARPPPPFLQRPASCSSYHCSALPRSPAPVVFAPRYSPFPVIVPAKPGCLTSMRIAARCPAQTPALSATKQSRASTSGAR